MKKPLRVLVLEDSAADAELNIRELRRVGLDVQWELAATEADYLASLDTAPDLILADFSLPSFTALSALKLLRERGLDVPFILISGTVGEDAAVEAMKLGAADYLFKDRLARLGASVERALEEKRLRTANRQAEEALRVNEERLRVAMDAARMGSWDWDMRTGEILWSEHHEILFGYQPGRLHRTYADFQKRLHPEDAARVEAALGEAMGKRTDYRCEFRVVWPDGSIHWMSGFGRFQFDAEGCPIRMVGVMQDISAQKSVEREIRKMNWGLESRVVERTLNLTLADAALRESEEHFRQLMQALPAAVYTCDAHGRITLFNAAAVALWGREPKARDRWGGAHRLFTPEGKRLPHSRSPMAMAALHAEPIRGAELIIERPDGSQSHVLNFADPTCDRTGAVSRVVNIVVDITALKQTENALTTSERSLRTLSRAVEQSPASVMITRVAGEIEYVNPRFTEVTGYSLQDVWGKTPGLLKSGHHPRKFYKELWQTITAGREWRGEFCNRKKNGESYWDFAVIAPIVDEHGAVTHYVSIAEDITERRQAQAALRESEERLRAIMNTVTDAIVTIDQRGLITSVNAAAVRMFGYAEPELIDQNATLLMPAFDHDGHDRSVAKLDGLDGARVLGKPRELEGRRKDGSAFPIDLALSEADHLQMFTGVIRDISDRKRLQAEVLRITEDERLRVAADLHDGICQELVGIQFFAHMLRTQLQSARHPLTGEARHIEKAIVGTTHHTRQVARGMSPVVADGSGLMHALRKLAETTTHSRRIRCIFECPASVSIENPTTANELYRIAMEAILNAVRHSRATRIIVRLSADDGQACLAVADNGRGLPGEASRAPGMGLQVMKYRAGLIGGQLVIQPRPRGGTEVICRMNKPTQTDETQTRQ